MAPRESSLIAVLDVSEETGILLQNLGLHISTFCCSVDTLSNLSMCVPRSQSQVVYMDYMHNLVLKPKTCNILLQSACVNCAFLSTSAKHIKRTGTQDRLSSPQTRPTTSPDQF